VGSGAEAETPSVSGATPHRLFQYVTRCLRLKHYLKAPGDGRLSPQIPAQAMLWAILIGQILRESSFHAIENLVGSRQRRSLGVSRSFGDDALGYFTERLDPAERSDAPYHHDRIVKTVFRAQ
jgi:hypothetical protein